METEFSIEHEFEMNPFDQESIDYWMGQLALGIGGTGGCRHVVQRMLSRTHDFGFDSGMKYAATVSAKVNSERKTMSKKTKGTKRTMSRKTKPSKRVAAKRK